MNELHRNNRHIRRISSAFAALIFALTICVSSMAGCSSKGTQQSTHSVRIGVSLYDQYDTFITELMESFTGYVEQRKSGGVDIVTVVRDAAGSQSSQNDQVREMIESGCNVLCVNLVDRTAPTEIIDLARKNNVPVIFFNRELVEEDLMQWEGLYYVGADAYQSGTLQGELGIEYCKDTPEADRNGDGNIQYVVLEGEAGHQDAILRTEYSVDTMIMQGVMMDKVGYAIANWNRAQARSKMEQLITSSDAQIELVLANNDDMALGAIDAYEAMEIPQDEWPLIFGIDGTSVGLQAVIEGKMTGTVYNDKEGQARAMEELAFRLAMNQPLSDLALPDGVELTDGKYIRLPYQKVDSEKAEDYLSK